MVEGITYRESKSEDLPSLERLYPEAFPDEDLLPLVRDLLKEQSSVFSLVGIIKSSVSAHAVFTRCELSGGAEKAALLGPIAVAPKHQRQGVGTAIIREGFQQMEKAGVAQILVLGDPAYYGRLGFKAEPNIDPPYQLPTEWRGAWLSLFLGKNNHATKGKLIVPKPWLQPALWLP